MHDYLKIQLPKAILKSFVGMLQVLFLDG